MTRDELIEHAKDAANFCALKGDRTHAAAIRELLAALAPEGATPAPDGCACGDGATLRGYIATYGETPAMTASNREHWKRRAEIAEAALAAAAPAPAPEIRADSRSMNETADESETCERCQMRLPQHLGTYTPGIRGSMAWRCAVCLPVTTASGRILREEVVRKRKAHWQAVTPAPAAGKRKVGPCAAHGVLACMVCMMDEATPAPAAGEAERPNWTSSCEGCPYPDSCSYFSRCTFRRAALTPKGGA